MKTSVYRKLIEDYYGDQKAKRSGVPYIKHINEGVNILEAMGVCEGAVKAFMIHPIFQSDDDLKKNSEVYCDIIDEPYIIMLVMEYRKLANSYLSKDYKGEDDIIILSPILEVNQMLWADKVQNYRDFVIYHRGKHARSNELDGYFANWIKILQDHI